jgi:hypothetical protein
MRKGKAGLISGAAFISFLGNAETAAAQSTSTTPSAVADVVATPQRPAIVPERWEENWSVLADPALRTEPLDSLKHIPFSQDGEAYLSLGANLRERVESYDAPLFGISGQKSNTYLLDRLQVHADLHVDGWQAFLQLEDAETLGKKSVSPADADRLDVEQAFITHVGRVGDGELKVRVGRQEFGFDLQRFVSVREGPNVRQAYDAVWGDYESGPWRIISFASHPTQYRNTADFDDYSGHNLVLDGFRVERQRVGLGNLAVYYLRYQNDTARFAAASGQERRNALDLHYSGTAGPIDFDAEAMGQQGEIENRRILAWAFGGRLGYTFQNEPWTPHFYVQVDAASGSTSRNGTLGTFNPLFPNGYYFPLAGLTTYANLMHLKPVISVMPDKTLTLQAAVGFQWRETTQDAIYTIPVQALPNTAGHGSLWTAVYFQLDVAKKISPNITLSAQAVRYEVGSTIRSAGGHDTTYANVQVSLAW